MKNTCRVLNDEINFFQDLLLDVLARRVIFKKFEEEIKKTCLAEHNDMLSLVWYGYVVSQLSDCRKFFDRDSNAHVFKLVVAHLGDETLKKKHCELYNAWKKENFIIIINKYLLHADVRFSKIKTNVSTRELDSFIDRLEEYLKEIVDDLSNNYSDVNALSHDSYLQERKLEVDTFFKEISKVSTG